MCSFKHCRNIVFFLLTLLSLSNISAQSIEGIIVSTLDNEPIPFANILIKGTTTGTASDLSGEFSLNIPKQHYNKYLIISIIGFKNQEIPINQLSFDKRNTIILSAEELKITEVDVLTESKILYGIIKKCSQNIQENYINIPYSCDFTYTNDNKEAAGTISDHRGYKRTSYRESYKDINYSFIQRDSIATNNPYFQGKTNMEDLLSYDLMRTTGNLIDEQNVYDFDLNSNSSKDSELLIIHFKAKNPQLYNTGDAHIVAYEGELHIKKDSYTVTKIILQGKADKRSLHSKSIKVTDETMRFTSNHNFEIEVNYTLDQEKYRLAEVNMTETYTTINDEVKTEKSSIVITKRNDKYTPINGRDYYINHL